MIYYISNTIYCMKTTKKFFEPKLAIGGGQKCTKATQYAMLKNFR